MFILKAVSVNRSPDLRRPTELRDRTDFMIGISFRP